MRITVILRSPTLQPVMAEALDAAGCTARITVGDLRALGRHLAGRRPDMWLAEADLDDAAQVAALEEFIHTAAAGAPVLVCTPSASLAGVRSAMRAGVADVLTLPLAAADIAAAVTDSTRATRPGRNTPAGAVFAFLKAGGGVGATTLATQAACALGCGSKGETSVCLVDLDVQFGAVALHLDLLHAADVLEVLAACDRLDGGMLRGTVARHGSGVDVLPAPAGMHALDSVGAEAALRLVDVARAEYRTVLVELPQAWTGWTRAVLATSTAIVLVLQPTVPSVRHARRQMETLAEEGLGHVPLILVANRAARFPFAAGISLKEVERALGRSLDHVVSEHGRAVVQAVNAGRPLDGRGAARQIGRLARRLAAFETGS